MNIRILVNGAKGKMGQMAVKAISAQPDFILAGATSRDCDLAAEIQQSQAAIVLDFTHVESVLKNTHVIIESGARPVIGTSGLLHDQVKLLQDRCLALKRGGIIAPNFSLGAILMMKQARDIVKYFPQVEIIEMHHAEKMDSPSGTAMRTAEILAEARTASPSRPQSTRETVAGARGALYQEIPIHAVRLPGLVAHQQIIFGGIGETLTVRCDTIDRQSYMPGIILACRKVLELNRLVYGLEHII
jgi:4-hydroxy-tetrahydrodipicolinate reductase